MKKLPSLLWVIGLVSMPALAAGGSGDHGFDWVYFIAKVLNTLIFFGVLYHFLKKPVAKFFTGRLQQIKQSLELAEKSREEAKQRLDEIETKMKHLDQEIADIEQQARQDAEAEKQRIQAQAKKEAERIKAQATAEIEHMKRQAILDLKAYVTTIAMDEAETALKKAMTTQEHKRVFKEFVDRVGAKL